MRTSPPFSVVWSSGASMRDIDQCPTSFGLLGSCAVRYLFLWENCDPLNIVTLNKTRRCKVSWSDVHDLRSGEDNDNNYNDPDWRHTAAYDNSEDHGGRENENFRITISPTSTSNPSKSEDLLNDEESVNEEGDDGDHNYYRSPANDEESQTLLISSAPSAPIKIRDSLNDRESMSEYLLDDRESVNEEGDDGDHNYYRSPANDEESQTLLISSAPSAPIKIRDSLNDRESMSEYLLDDRESTSEEGDDGDHNYYRSPANDEESQTLLISSAPSAPIKIRDSLNDRESMSEYLLDDRESTSEEGDDGDHNYYRSPANDEESQTLLISSAPSAPIKIRDSLNDRESMSEYLLDDRESTSEEGDDGHNYYRSPANDEESQTLLISSAPSAPIKIRDSLNDRESMSEYLLDDRESTSEEGDDGDHNYYRSPAYDEESQIFLIPSTSPGFRETNDNNYNHPDWRHAAAYDNSEDHGGRENEDFRISISPTSTSNPSKSEDLLNDEESVNEEGDDGDHNYYRSPAYDEESQIFLIPSTSPGFRETNDNNYNDPDWRHAAAYDNSEDHGGRENENFRIIISPQFYLHPSKSARILLNDEESVNEEGDETATTTIIVALLTTKNPRYSSFPVPPQVSGRPTTTTTTIQIGVILLLMTTVKITAVEKTKISG
ncbi:hypothetical protein OSTOST_21453 [Ostertagia ostertagi]